MDSSDFAHLQQGVEELQNRRFEFCTRCGARVQPYRSNEFLDHDESWNYDQRLSADDTIPDEESVYWCAHCASRWRAFGAGDTGHQWSCGHFMPFYVNVCAICGVRR